VAQAAVVVMAIRTRSARPSPVNVSIVTV